MPSVLGFNHLMADQTAALNPLCMLIQQHLITEAEAAVKPGNGLHIIAVSKMGKRQLEWRDVGTSMLGDVQAVLKTFQPLTWEYVMQIAGRKPRMRDGKLQITMHILSILNYSQTEGAKCIPMMYGLLYWACRAHTTLYRVGSRIGLVPSYSTVCQCLVTLSKQEAKLVLDLGQDPARKLMLRMDNVQRYVKAWQSGIGRACKMLKGMAATAVEIMDCNPIAWDLDDKLVWLRKQEQLTVALLTELRKHVKMLYKTRVKKRAPIECRKTNVHPLATSKKDKNITTELKDALVDFLGQLGQKDGQYNKCLILVGGDGLMYEKIIQIKQYLQFHDDAFKTFDVVEPMLELWHTEWTDLSRIHETHWGDPLMKDPLLLGHSATAIGWKTPPNLSKVEYYPSIQLTYLVLDCRMLDCWRNHFGVTDLFDHFRKLKATDQLPTIEEFEKAAKILHRMFSSQRGYDQALREELRSPWSPPEQQNTAKSKPTKNPRKRKGKGKKSSKPEVTSSKDCGKPGPVGDTEPQSAKQAKGGKSRGKAKAKEKGKVKVVASQGDGDDREVLREAAAAVVSGDTGWVYECLKVMLFTFAGSTHTKYMGYLLKTITSLELECSDALRDAFMDNWVVNVKGQEGCNIEGDLMQEHFNLDLEEQVDRKDIDFNNLFMTDVTSQNLHHLSHIKSEIEEGLGLKAHTTKHTSPHLRPEVKVLLDLYQSEELHCW
ncbi:hypothetical protein JAAARDRAFT_50112 [Jaapia argillacea MUCL 33604]|uniref:DUF6589 domain-containing protein n=1 Tax=Jaapia argillacea MUCL 33604 TaxID=933084 RepID=A0A067PGK2_9AGAM|nr:hypothetical protein JAAARDRAFT_50112 [Jaapia argillacea MUCL 33604]